MISKFSLAFGLMAVLGISALPSGSVGSFVGAAQARTAPDTGQRSPVPTSRKPRPTLPFGTAFSENFDTYTAGSNVHGQGGWKGWGNDSAAGALVDDAFSVSAPNSINIELASDLIHEFSGYTAGIYTITAQMYIPGDFSGRTYFIFENAYTDAVDPNILSWSVQVAFDSTTGNVENEQGAADPGSLPYVTGEWVPIQLVVDLDADTQTFSYNGQVLYTGSWTDQFPDQNVAGSLNIGSIDLYANSATPVYYDNISIAVGAPAEFGVTLSAGPTSSTGLPGETVTYTVTVTNTGTQDDTYDVTAFGSVFTATPSAATVAVAAGQSGTVDIAVEIPLAAAIGTLSATAVAATSQGDPTVSGSITLTTTVAEDDTIFADGFDGAAP